MSEDEPLIPTEDARHAISTPPLTETHPQRELIGNPNEEIDPLKRIENKRTSDIYHLGINILSKLSSLRLLNEDPPDTSLSTHDESSHVRLERSTAIGGESNPEFRVPLDSAKTELLNWFFQRGGVERSLPSRQVQSSIHFQRTLDIMKFYLEHGDIMPPNPDKVEVVSALKGKSATERLIALAKGQRHDGFTYVVSYADRANVATTTKKNFVDYSLAHVYFAGRISASASSHLTIKAKAIIMAGESGEKTTFQSDVFALTGGGNFRDGTVNARAVYLDGGSSQRAIIKDANSVTIGPNVSFSANEVHADHVNNNSRNSVNNTFYTQHYEGKQRGETIKDAPLMALKS